MYHIFRYICTIMYLVTWHIFRDSAAYRLSKLCDVEAILLGSTNGQGLGSGKHREPIRKNMKKLLEIVRISYEYYKISKHMI